MDMMKGGAERPGGTTTGGGHQEVAQDAVHLVGVSSAGPTVPVLARRFCAPVGRG
jgi:hypothetical protein